MDGATGHQTLSEDYFNVAGIYCGGVTCCEPTTLFSHPPRMHGLLHARSDCSGELKYGFLANLFTPQGSRVRVYLSAFERTTKERTAVFHLGDKFIFLRPEPRKITRAPYLSVCVSMICKCMSQKRCMCISGCSFVSIYRFLFISRVTGFGLLR